MPDQQQAPPDDSPTVTRYADDTASLQAWLLSNAPYADQRRRAGAS